MSARRPFALEIAVPASLVSDTPHLREKTMRIGLVGRAAAIFNVSKVLIYADRYGLADQRQDGQLIALVLSYMETPQYLRKRLFPRVDVLKYAGILPPLRTTHHPLSSTLRSLQDGELREGVVLKDSQGRSLIDVGVENPLPYSGTEPPGSRVTALIRRDGVLRAEPSLKVRTGFYHGYTPLFVEKPPGLLARQSGADLTIATSRYGVPITSVREELAERLKAARSILVLFGSPREGLREILRRENLTPQQVASFVVNMVPGQGTETVRTEEAVLISLAVLNALT
ncbi:MAG: RNA methyltransferase [Candidatus Bathyarchaeia archaeon]